MLFSYASSFSCPRSKAFAAIIAPTMSSVGSLDSSLMTYSVSQGAGMNDADPSKVTGVLLSGGSKALTSSFVVHSSNSSKVGVRMLQSLTAWLSFKTTHAAWGPNPIKQEILLVGRFLVPPWFLGLWMTATFLFKSAMKITVSTSSANEFSLTPMLWVELIERLNDSMFRFPCSFPGRERKCCFHALVRFILVLFN